MTDIVQRLRMVGNVSQTQMVKDSLEAAVEIERLREWQQRVISNFGPPQDDCECFMCDIQREQQGATDSGTGGKK